jgi:hypothetical protein
MMSDFSLLFKSKESGDVLIQVWTPGEFIGICIRKDQLILYLWHKNFNVWFLMQQLMFYS